MLEEDTEDEDDRLHDDFFNQDEEYNAPYGGGLPLPQITPSQLREPSKSFSKTTA